MPITQKKVLYFAVSLLVIANTINIGADLGAMAARVAFPFLAMLHNGINYCLGGFVIYRTYSKILKYLALTLFAYVLTAFIFKLDWGIIVKNTVLL